MERTNDTPIAYKFSVKEAAERMGISEPAVRQRIKRGTIDVRRNGGSVFVMLNQGIIDAEKERQRRTSARSRSVQSTMVRTTEELSSQNSELANDPQPSGKAFDDLAEAFAHDMKRQIERLEGQVDNLQAELRHKDDQHGNEMERKDILLQGYQKQVETLTERIGIMAARPQLIASTAALVNQEGEKEEAKATRQVLAGIVDMLGRIYRRGREN